MTADEIQAVIDAAFAGPAKVTAAAGSVEARSLEELQDFQDRQNVGGVNDNTTFFGMGVRKARFGRRSPGSFAE